MRARSYHITKRVLDVAVSLLLLVVTLPVSAAVAAAVALSMGRPIFFRQRRPGRHGVSFELIKFRTMRNSPGSDAQRLTSIGRFLRSTSLDELPELWNVVRGDMSLVGPRPLLMDYLPLYNEHQARRHEMRPGVTGWAQINGRNAISWEQKLDYDIEYIDGASFALDVKILARTVATVTSRDGISADGEATIGHFTGSPTPETAEVA